MWKGSSMCTLFPRVAARYSQEPPPQHTHAHSPIYANSASDLCDKQISRGKKCDWHTVDQSRNVRATEGKERLISLILSGISYIPTYCQKL